MATKTIISLAVSAFVLLFGGVTLGRFSAGSDSASVSRWDSPPTFAEVQKYCPDAFANMYDKYKSADGSPIIIKHESGGFAEAGYRYELSISGSEPVLQNESGQYWVFERSKNGWVDKYRVIEHRPTTKIDYTPCIIPR